MRAGRPGKAGPRTRRTFRVTCLLVAILGLLLVGCADEVVTELRPGVMDQNALDPQGPIAADLDRLWNIVFWIAVGVFVLVQTMLLVAVFKFRARGDEQRLPRQVAGNSRLEILWTAIPALILVVIAIPTLQTLFAVAAEPADAERLDVRVVAKQYWWEFEYLDTGVVTANELHIPVDVPVLLHMEALSAVVPDPGGLGVKAGPIADGVIHSFWVPRLAGKQDVVPGHVRTLRLEAVEPGQRYSGQCAEFCGLSHPNMRFHVVTHTQADFDAWVQQQAQPVAAAAGGVAAQGEQLFGANCVACHTVQGHAENLDVRVAPNLTHFASREIFAGGIFDVEDSEQLKRWIRNAPEQKPGVQMPAFPNFTDEDLEALAAYLYSLQ